MTPRMKAGAAGFALILATNAIAIGGALYNRGGEPEARLALSERELTAPYAWESREENSGLSLMLTWRTASDDPGQHYRPYGREADWLDQEKLEALGFDVRYEPRDDRASRHYARQLPRDALVVLELDGPAYAAALEMARRDVAEAEASAARDADAKRTEALKDARKRLQREQELSSRLFAVDAGPELGPLRARYPDASRYAIVRAHVDIGICDVGRGDSRVCGHVEELEVPRINVPLELRPAFEGVEPGWLVDDDEPRVRYTAVVAFGRRLEPWLESAERVK